MVVTCRLPIFLNMYRLRLAQKIKIVYVPVAFSKHSFSITKSLASIQKIVLEFSQTESLEKSYLTEIRSQNFFCSECFFKCINGS